jgi:predicted regulator of Ras-like GTPase activity (Roadblock/LC7/MglB family)
MPAVTVPAGKSSSGMASVSRPASGLSPRVSGLMPKTQVPPPLPQAPAAPVKARDQFYASGLTEIRSIAGVTGALIVDQFGLVVAANLDPSLDEGLAGALITNVYRSASNNAAKLGVGQFEEGIIEGADGNIHIVQFDDMILTIFAAGDVKLGLLEKSIRDFAEAAQQNGKK